MFITSDSGSGEIMNRVHLVSSALSQLQLSVHFYSTNNEHDKLPMVACMICSIFKEFD